MAEDNHCDLCGVDIKHGCWCHHCQWKAAYEVDSNLPIRDKLIAIIFTLSYIINMLF